MIRIDIVGVAGHIDIPSNETMGVPNVGDVIRVRIPGDEEKKTVFNEYTVLSRTFLYYEGTIPFSDKIILNEDKVLITVMQT